MFYLWINTIYFNVLFNALNNFEYWNLIIAIILKKIISTINTINPFLALVFSSSFIVDDDKNLNVLIIKTIDNIIPKPLNINAIK